jgi:hypothetical protein
MSATTPIGPFSPNTTLAAQCTGPTPGTQVQADDVNGALGSIETDMITIRVNMTSIYQWQWNATAGDPVGLYLRGYDGVNIAQINLGNFAQVIFQGNGSTGAVWTPSSFASFQEGSTLTMQSGSTEIVAGGGTSVWQYEALSSQLAFDGSGPIVQSNTAFGFGNAVGIVSAALTSAGIQITCSGSPGINSGDYVILSVPGCLAAPEYVYAWSLGADVFAIAAAAIGAWTSGGAVAPVRWAISAITVGANTAITTTHAHSLSAGDSVYLANIVGTCGAVLNAATAASPLVVLSSGLTSTAFEVAINTTGDAYTSGGVGGKLANVSFVSSTGVAETGAVLTTAVAHGLNSGMYVQLDSLAGGTAASNLNGVWPVGVIDSTHIVVFGIQGGSGTWSSGGFVAYTSVQTTAAGLGGSYTAPAVTWDSLGTGASIVVQRGFVRFVGPAWPQGATPPKNAIPPDGCTIAKVMGTWTTTGVSEAALTVGDEYNATAFTLSGSPNTIVINFDTPFKTANYAVSIQLIEGTSGTSRPLPTGIAKTASSLQFAVKDDGGPVTVDTLAGLVVDVTATGRQ